MWLEQYLYKSFSKVFYFDRRTQFESIMKQSKKESKVVPLHAMEAFWVTGGIASTVS
jgi:hypothetical protein